jgi:ribosomal protein S18 acetylase RimI-like enzyme
MKEYITRLLEKKDCTEAAKLRLATQEWGFLPAMGLSFQIEILKGTCGSKWGFGIVCVGENEKILGMVYAATKLSSYYKSIFLRRGFMLAFWAVLKILQNPKLFNGLLQYFIYPRKVPFKQIEAEWLTMIVDIKHRNKGIAKKLTLSLIDEYRKRGIRRFRSTVATKNTITCCLHEKFGFKLLGTFPLCGEQINIYEYEFPPDN